MQGGVKTHNPSNLADVLDRILDKGVVVAGDISVSLVGVELLTIRLRLLIASVDKAKELGIGWWEKDPFLNSEAEDLALENEDLRERLAALETQLAAITDQTDEVNPFEVEDPSGQEGGKIKSKTLTY